MPIGGRTNTEEAQMHYIVVVTIDSETRLPKVEFITDVKESLNPLGDFTFCAERFCSALRGENLSKAFADGRYVSPDGHTAVLIYHDVP
jgi:hypothetical protein